MPLSKPNIAKENTTFAEQFFSQASDSIQLIFDLTSRIDERVKILNESQHNLDARVDKLIETNQNTNSRLFVMESKDFSHLKEDLTEIKQKVLLLERFAEKIEELNTKLQGLEIKVEMITIKLGNHDNRWLLAFDAVWKIGLMCVAGWILFKLGLQSPPS